MGQAPDLLKMLKIYAQSDMYPFHMPGHKRQLGDAEDLLQDPTSERHKSDSHKSDSHKFEGHKQDTGLELYNFPNPFSIDITEIEGFDYLHHPEGILKESMDWAAEVYGADRTCYLVNGSSCGILSAIFGTVNHGGRILMSRNCHKSAYHGVILNRLDAVYIYPQMIDDFGLQGGLLVSDIEKLLTEHDDIQAVLIVSPTYDGVVSDVKAIADTVHKFGLPLIVDEAHGAHFSFGEKGGFPESAASLGADIVIQSLHKTLPAFTQSAVLHMNRGYVDIGKVERYLHMFQSSSPSYLLMAGMEQAIRYMDGHGRAEMEGFGVWLDGMRSELKVMNHLQLLPCSIGEGPLPVSNFVNESKISYDDKGIYAIDKSKIIISCRNTSMSGRQLDKILRDRYHLEMEMCGPDYVTAITTVSDTQEGLDRLKNALLMIDGEMDGEINEKIDDKMSQVNLGLNQTDGSVKQIADERSPYFAAVPRVEMSLADALDSRQVPVPLAQSEGLISAEFVYLYPPGIPIVAPGEQLTGPLIKLIEKYRLMGLPVQGMADPSIGTILTAVK